MCSICIMAGCGRVGSLACRCESASRDAGRRRGNAGGSGATRLPGASALGGVPASSPSLPKQLPPCVGRVVSTAKSWECLVAGVVHTPSAKQQQELRAVIEAAAPDVVLLELDQGRLNTLLELGPSTSYGAELATAASAAWASGSVVLLGDVRARDSFAALFEPGQVVDPKRLRAGATLALSSMLSGVGAAPRSTSQENVDVLAALLDDPAKLAPIAGTFALTVALVAVTSATWHTYTGTPADQAASLAFLVFQAAALLRVFDVFLLARDEALAASAIRALEIGSGLRRGRLLRRSWTFHSDPEALAVARAARPTPDGATPFFTLRRPLAEGETRRLNLFEPRWLALMDELAGVMPEGSIVGATFGTIAVQNRIYSPGGEGMSSSGSVSDDLELSTSGERLADIVVEPVARMVRVVAAEEGARPVTGARKVTLWIEGQELRRVDPASLQGCGGGYLAGTVLGPATESRDGASEDEERAPLDADAEQPPVRVVCVVGLAHANGVIDRCATQMLA